MASSRIIKSTTEASAHPSGLAFDDITSLKDPQAAKISRIVISFNKYIRSITIHYTNQVGPCRGAVEGTQSEVVLTDGEFITSIDGSIIPVAISHLSFVTNKGRRWGPFGQRNPEDEFHWGDWGPNMGLLYFSGRTDSYFRCLRASFATYPPCALPPSVLRYEKQVIRSLEDTQPDSLSTFGQNLLSPTVILAVGNKATEIHASQGLLCQLPFFRAALEGKFREATEKRISMPDDDLRSVAALVEYLYTGHYTYPFHNTSETELDVPAADVAEGSFHVFVYATANKYGCEQLVDASLTSYLNVLSNLKGIDVFRLWVIAYDQGLVLDTVATGASVVTATNRLGQLLKGVYTTDREEMDRITLEHPRLIGDVLRHVVSKEY